MTPAQQAALDALTFYAWMSTGAVALSAVAVALSLYVLIRNRREDA